MLLVSLAFAHTPHDTVVGAAEGFVIVDADGASLLLARDGDFWPMVGGEPTAEVLLGAVYSAYRRWTFDGAWHAEDFPAEMSVANERLWGGPSGLWLDGQKVLDDAIVDVGDGVAVLADGRVWSDGTLLTLPEPIAVATPGYAAGTTVWRFDGAPCAPLAATRLVSDGQVVLAATDDGAPWVSTDGCATWEDRRAPLPVSLGRMGDAAARHVFTSLEIDGDAWTVAGWEGVATTEDAGSTWNVPPLISAAHTRGLAEDDDGCILVGAYGAGVLRTCDGGRSFTAESAGLTDPNVQRLSGEYIVAGHDLWCSTDAAASWSPVDTPVDEVVGVWSRSDLWIAGSREEGVWVRDGDWRRVPELEEGTLRGVAEIDGRVCAATRDPVRITCDGELVYDADGDVVAGPIDDGGLTWGDAFGVHRGDVVVDLGEPVSVLIPGAVATRGGRVVTDDGDVRLPAQVYALLDTGEGVLAATHDGVYLVRDGVAERWGALERVDDRSPMMTCDDCPDRYGRADAGMSTMQPLGTVSTWVRGETVRVIGDGDFTADIDGVEVSAGCGGGLEVSALEPGWHAVTVKGDGMVDAVEGWSEGVGLGHPSRCGGGGSALVLVWMARRRRRA